MIDPHPPPPRTHSYVAFNYVSPLRNMFFMLPFSKKILLGTAKPINFPKKYENKISLVGNILKEEIMNYKLLKKKQIIKIMII